jgi:plastocyanin
MKRIALLVMAVAVALPVALAVAATKVTGTVGPDFVITLKAKTLKAGSYTIAVTDKADIHSFHLTGPGVNKVITGVAFQGTKSVTLALKAGTYKYFCDVHPADMHGSFKVTG